MLSDFTRELLRDQPENVYEYGARYFAALDEGGEFEYVQANQTGSVPAEIQPGGGNKKETYEEFLLASSKEMPA